MYIYIYRGILKSNKIEQEKKERKKTNPKCHSLDRKTLIIIIENQYKQI